MAEIKETCIECVDADNVATVSSSERKWINKIYKLKELYPNEVEIVRTAEDNYGVVLAHVPKSWMKLSPPKKVSWTDEQREAAAERLRKAREAK